MFYSREELAVEHQQQQQDVGKIKWLCEIVMFSHGYRAMVEIKRKTLLLLFNFVFCELRIIPPKSCGILKSNQNNDTFPMNV